MKKIISLILALCMAFSLCATAFAADLTAGGSSEISTSGGTESSEVKLTIGDGAGGGVGSGAFKVTVPTALPFAVSSAGVVSAATDAKIVNNSNGPIKVTNVVAKGANGWSVAANGTNFQRVAVDSKQFTMTLNGDNFPAAATGADSALTLTAASWPTIDGKGGELALTYTGDFAIQSANLTDAKIADVVFTVAWSTAG